MEDFRKSDPEFYAGYNSARVIIDAGTRHTTGKEQKKIPPDTNPQVEK